MSATLEHSPLPSRHAVRNLIEELLGRDIELGDGLPPEHRSTNVVAVYVTDKLHVSAMVVLNLEGAARIGGALAMIPRGVVQEAISARDLTATLKENCYEVFNVMSAVFNVPGAPHVRLYEMYGPKALIPTDIAALASSSSRMDVRFTVGGYGTGRLSIIVP